MTLIQRNGSAQGVNPWLKTTVQQFFQDLNWEGNRAQPQAKPSQPSSASGAVSPSVSTATPSHLTLTMSVSQYMEAIAWEGTPIIAAPLPVTEPAKPAPAEKNVTLDDFFGSF